MAKKETPSTKAEGVGAGNVTRTRDLLITNQLLYQLSYSSTVSYTHLDVYKRQISWFHRKAAFESTWGKKNGVPFTASASSTCPCGTG